MIEVTVSNFISVSTKEVTSEVNSSTFKLATNLFSNNLNSFMLDLTLQIVSPVLLKNIEKKIIKRTCRLADVHVSAPIFGSTGAQAAFLQAGEHYEGKLQDAFGKCCISLSEFYFT